MKNPGSHNQDFRTLPGLWPDMRGLRALDLGCGSGLYTRELASQGAKVIGLDLDLDGVRRARDQQGVSLCQWVCADARHLPFKEGAFAMVNCVEVLTHIETRERNNALAEVARVLKVGGIFYFSVHNRRRLTLARWLRMSSASLVYRTPNLSVWPTTPNEIRIALAACNLLSHSGVHYANFHSRFTYVFYTAHPFWARQVIRCENLLARVPVLRKLAITFIWSAKKKSCDLQEESSR